MQAFNALTIQTLGRHLQKPLLAVMAASLLCAPGFAAQAVTATPAKLPTQSTPAQPAAPVEDTAPVASPAKADNGLPPEEHAVPKAQIDEQKLAVAKELTNWLNHTLADKKVLVAVVAREGGEATKKHDKTGMGHAGLAVYDPRAQSYIIYNLVNTQLGKDPEASIWRSGPVDFFYGQKGYNKEALILIPDATTQARMYEAIITGKYKQLFLTNDYNLLSSASSTTSLNCNKWLLMNIVAARIDDYNSYNVLGVIGNRYEAGEIKINAIERQFVKNKPTVRASEIPTFGPIKTVTVESLYRSDIFTEKAFYSGQKI